MNKFVLAIFAAFCLGGLLIVSSVSVSAQAKDYTKYVNPFIGTGGHGHTFPGATRPFGMVQLSPDTRIDNWDGSSGYHYSDDVIYGFSHTHLSGTGIPDGCDILFMPTIGEPQFFAKDGDKSVNGYASKFSHANERAEPGYYSVVLDDGILVELTATKRVGFHRYTFPRSGQKNLLLDLKWRDKVQASELRIIGTNRLEGYRRSTSWSKNQTVYFVAEFAKPFESARIFDADGPIKDWKYGGEFHSSIGKDIKASFSLGSQAGDQVIIKVAISYVSIEGARKNLEAELPGWDFDKVRAEAKDEWNKELSKIEVSGGTDEQTTNFYSALYHTMIHPNVFNDVDGKYRGHDGKVHQLPGYENSVGIKGKGGKGEKTPHSTLHTPQTQYTVFSLWDTFRAAHPLYTIIDQKRTADFINTFIRQYEQGGRLPVWELWGEETDTMIGFHAVSVIADAMAKNIKGFDYEKAYKAAKHSAELDHFGLAGYKKRGYISSEDENESVSKTLEYAYDDYCIASMAETLIRLRQIENKAAGRKDDDDAVFKGYVADHQKYIIRAKNYANLFDHADKFFRPKKNGGFIKPFEPNEVTFHFTEGNSWQYSFFVPQDVSGLIELMGGRQQFERKLDELFTTEQKLSGRFQPDITGLMGQYAHGNEPSHHIPYLYNFVHKPSKTQARVRKIMDEFYKNTPDGLIGNEDCGQMSAWYVLSAVGFYPVTPGQTYYDFGTPLFKEVKFNLENGNTFTVKADNVSDKNIYIKNSRLNGKPNYHSYIRQDDIMWGGVLEFEMDSQPNDKAFIKFSNTGIYLPYVPVPVIESAGRSFADKAVIVIHPTKPASEIYYTLDGTEPTETSHIYSEPIVIDKTTNIKAVAIAKDNVRSYVVEASFLKRSNDRKVVSTSGYSTQYTGGGDEGLVDEIRGTKNFSSGEWQGYQGKTFEAVIDLNRETEISEAGGGFLQATGAWIWMPQRMEISISNDGEDFKDVASFETKHPTRDTKDEVKEFTAKFAKVKARFVKIKAFNFGKIPDWHLGAGGDPWIFVDEIIIK